MTTNNIVSPPQFTFGGDAEKGIDRADGIIAAAKMYIASLSAEDSDLPVAERAEKALSGFVDALAMFCPNQETGPDRLRWSAAACQSMRELLEALRAIDQAEPGTVPITVLARAGAETIRWELVNRHVPDAELWTWLGELFVAECDDDEILEVTGEGETIAREYLRAIAYHAVALDQQTLKIGFAVARLVTQLLSDLSLTREHTEGSMYGIEMARCGVPVRLAKASSSFVGWRFVTAEAADRLSEIHRELIQGQYSPVGLEKINIEELRSAVVHLRREWSFNPPMRRHRRYSLNARLCVVRGYEQAMSLLNGDAEEAVAVGAGTWRITNLSRGGIGAIIPRNLRAGVPVAGDLVAFCPEEGTKWHIGVVRRLRISKTHIEIGIATLSSNPGLALVEDGRVQRELCACDPIRRGEAIRLLGPVGVLGDDTPLFFRTDDAIIHKLRPLANTLRGKSFDLRIYQVT